MNAAQNFVKTARKTLRDDSEMETIRAKKGKRNKPSRGNRTEWVPLAAEASIRPNRKTHFAQETN